MGMVGGLQGEAPVADAAAVALLLVHLHDVLQVLLPAAEGELRMHTLFTCARSPSPRLTRHSLHAGALGTGGEPASMQ